MGATSVSCPHCGAWFVDTEDQRCPRCGNSLVETALPPGDVVQPAAGEYIAAFEDVPPASEPRPATEDVRPDPVPSPAGTPLPPWIAGAERPPPVTDDDLPVPEPMPDDLPVHELSGREAPSPWREPVLQPPLPTQEPKKRFGRKRADKPDVRAGATKPEKKADVKAAARTDAKAAKQQTSASKAAGRPTLRVAGDLRPLIWLFGAVGLGLGIATVIFLKTFGLLSATSSIALLGDSQSSSSGEGAALVFVLLCGVVLAAFVGARLANGPGTRRQAAASAAVAGAAGHVVLVVVAGVVMLIGISVLKPGAAAPAATVAPLTPIPTASAAASSNPNVAPCAETFGANSPLCSSAAPVPSLPGITSGIPGIGGLPGVVPQGSGPELITAKSLAKVGLGLFPAALVAALCAALLFARRPDEFPSPQT